MKNKTITSYFILLTIATLLSIYIPKNEVTAKEEIIIPNEAIRLRILANSDSEHDQALKRKVRDAVNAEITEWVQDLTSIEEARSIIKSRLPEIQQIAKEIVESENETQAIKAEFGKVEFPTKLYGQFLYPAGEYEAILITLGEGEGANWWCVLFPPLCFLDFSNGVAVSDGFDEGKDMKKEKPKKSKQTENPKTSKENQQEDINKNENQAASTKQASQAKVTSVSKTEQQSVVAQIKTFSQSEKEVPTAGTNAVGKKSTQNSEAEKEDSKEITSENPKSENPKSEKANSDKIPTKSKEKAPVYTSEDAQEVKVKFFVAELWNKLFS